MARATPQVSFRTEVFPTDGYTSQAAALIQEAIPSSGTIVVTGGTTAARVYPELSMAADVLDIFFSDERCVPPDDDASNFKMASETFLSRSNSRVHRMRGELGPDEAAADYHNKIAPFVARGFDLMMLGMGADCHVGALFPGSSALDETRFCAAVERPDGLQGLTLTPPAMKAARKILLLVTGAEKTDAVRRVVLGTEDVSECPARLLADHPDVTFLLDEPAAAKT
ncbi:MAG: 6-phosphogluconolactonase [Actinomycetota bacterium]